MLNSARDNPGTPQNVKEALDEAVVSVFSDVLVVWRSLLQFSLMTAYLFCCRKPSLIQNYILFLPWENLLVVLWQDSCR